jgi:hypothetical protein
MPCAAGDLWTVNSGKEKKKKKTQFQGSMVIDPVPISYISGRNFYTKMVSGAIPEFA